MPGPFPGMDPYLEHPHLWQGVHNKLITHIEETLNSVLPPAYVANVEGRCYVMPADRLMGKTYIRPDVVITQPSEYKGESSGGAAVLETVESYIIEPLPLEVNEAYVDILDAEDQSRVVTTIELLSYTNKNAGDKGRRLYLRKQKAMLESPTHLLEIDLLRDGLYTVAAPKDRLKQPHRHDYIACLHRWYQPLACEVWPFTVRDRLPKLVIPLDKDVPEIPFDLQPIFDSFYDAGAYPRKINYREAPEPPLTDVDALWADALLQEKCLR